MEGKTVTIDNYSIIEEEPGYFVIKMNGTPCMYLNKSDGLSKRMMRNILLDYINKRTMESTNYVRETALELTKTWCGQQGVPAKMSTVLDNYKYALEELVKYDK